MSFPYSGTALFVWLLVDHLTSLQYLSPAITTVIRSEVPFVAASDRRYGAADPPEISVWSGTCPSRALCREQRGVVLEDERSTACTRRRQPFRRSSCVREAAALVKAPFYPMHCPMATIR